MTADTCLRLVGVRMAVYSRPTSRLAVRMSCLSNNTRSVLGSTLLSLLVRVCAPIVLKHSQLHGQRSFMLSDTSSCLRRFELRRLNRRQS